MTFITGRFNTIGKRLMIPSLAVLVILLGSLGASLIMNQYEATRSMIESKARTIASLLQKISAPFIVNYDYPPLEGFVQEAMKNPEIVFVVYFDEKKKPITSNSKEPADISSVLVYEHEIQDSEGKTIGFLKTGYSKKALSDVLQRGISRSMISIVVAIALMTVALMVVIRSHVRSLRIIAGGVNEGAQKVASASQQISSSTQLLADNGSEQAASLEEISSSVEEMMSMTKQNSANTNHSKGMMDQAAQVIQKVNDHMEQMEKAMIKIRGSSEDTAKIIKTIDEIAFQTNLLALNAAVEAARAGEAGAGFAVVASEVRNLAMRASQAAKNTSELIEATVRAVRSGSDLTSATREAFKSNLEISKTIKTLIEEISAASQEQARGIEQINSGIAAMNSSVQKNAAGAEESASAAEEMSAQAEEMRWHAEKLMALIGGHGTFEDRNANFLMPDQNQESLKKETALRRPQRVTGS